MNLNETEVNNYLKPFLGQFEDSFQEAWVKILESKPQTLEEVTPIIKKVKSKEVNQCLNRKYKEVSLYKPIGRNGDEEFTLESILASPENENIGDGDQDNGREGLYRKIVDFLIGEYFNKKNENIELRRKDIELKAERLRLREDCLKLSSDLDSIASQERKSRSELVREAVRQYILLSRWKTLRQKASLKAIQQGLKEEDVERLIDEERSAHRRRH